MYALRNIHPNAIRGMLGTIAVSYGIPILHTKDEKDTASLLLVIAKREEEGDKKEFSPHADRKPPTMKEQQEYLVSALPSVGPSLAKVLLKQFGSVKNIINSTEEELMKIDGVGSKIAKVIREMVEKEY